MPYSWDLNPLDYRIWGALEKRSCTTPHPNVDTLKAVVENKWDNMSKDFIKKMHAAFRPRIEAMLAVDRAHLEKIKG